MFSRKLSIVFVLCALLLPAVHAQDDLQFESAINFQGQTISVPGTLGILRQTKDCTPEEAAQATDEYAFCHYMDGARYDDPDAPFARLTLYNTALLPSVSTENRLNIFMSGLGIFNQVLDESISLAAYGAHNSDISGLKLQALQPQTRSTNLMALAAPQYIKFKGKNIGVQYVAVDVQGEQHTVYIEFLFFLPNTRILAIYSVPVAEANSGNKSFGTYLTGKLTGTTPLDRVIQLEAALEAYASANITSSAAFNRYTTAIQQLLTSSKTTPFVDVFPSTPYAEAILDIRSQGIIQGYSDSTFRPTLAVNRAEFMKILLEANGAKNLDRFASQCFPDVDKSQWYAKYVCYGKEKGIIAGYSDGTFRPQSTINLAEGLKIIFNTYQINVGTGGEWYQPYLDEARRRGMLVLISAQVGDTLSRGEMAELMYRLLSN